MRPCMFDGMAPHYKMQGRLSEAHRCSKPAMGSEQCGRRSDSVAVCLNSAVVADLHSCLHIAVSLSHASCIPTSADTHCGKTSPR